MASFNYNLQQPYIRENNNKRFNPNETRLYLFVIEDRGNVGKLKTEFKVKATQWDFKKQRIKPSVAGSVVINSNLDELKVKITDQYYQLRKDYPGMKFPEIITNLKGFIQTRISPIYSEANKPFFTVFDEYINAKLDIVSELTIKKYKTLKQSLMNFDPSLTFDKIDLNFFDKYVRYLRTREPKGRMKTRAEDLQKGLLNDSVAKYIEGLKNFMKWGFEREKHANNVYINSEFSTERSSKNEIVTLRLDELQKFYEFDFSGNSRLERIRDLFCFACFTGQRWSDITAVNEGQIDGERWIFTSYKTDKKVIVPLVGYAAPALDILRKYDFRFRSITSQKFNEYLKEAGKLAGLDRPIKITRYIGNREVIFEGPLHEFMSSHMGRRTAVSLLLNVERMPIHQVRDITQHSDLKTLDKYLDKDDDALIQSMKQTKGIGKAILKILKKEAI